MNSFSLWEQTLGWLKLKSHSRSALRSKLSLSTYFAWVATDSRQLLAIPQVRPVEFFVSDSLLILTHAGEIAAAYAAGFVSAHDAIRIAFFRGLYAKLAVSPDGNMGAMMVVGTSLDDAAAFCDLQDLEGRIQIAAHNSSSSFTLSGDEDAVMAAVETFQDEQKFARRLQVDTAYHSPHMLPCAEPYLRMLIKYGIGTLPVEPNFDEWNSTWYSSVLNRKIMLPKDMTPEYWVANMTQPVLFSSAVATAVTSERPFHIVIEVGPHAALKGPVMDNLEGSGLQIPYTGLLARAKSDVDSLSKALGVIWTLLGIGSIDFANLRSKLTGDGVQSNVVRDLPGYPFDHTRRYWVASRVAGSFAQHQEAPHPLLGRRCIPTSTGSEIQWRNVLRPTEVSWLHGHQLQNQMVFPATGYICMAIEAVNILAKGAQVSMFKLTDVHLDKAISFNDEGASVETLFSVKIVETSSISIQATWTCYSSALGEKALKVNGRGHIEATLSELSVDTLPFSKLEAPPNFVDINVDRFYRALTKVGYQYEHPFHGITDIRRKLSYAQGHLVDQSGSSWEDQLLFHPGLLDTALQTMLAAFSCPGDERLWALHVPVRFEAVVLNPLFASHGSSAGLPMPYESSVRDAEPMVSNVSICADVQVFNPEGRHTFLQMEGVTLVPFSPPGPQNDSLLFSSFSYQVARPCGELTARGERLTVDQTLTAKEMERVAYFYIRRLSESIPAEERVDALAHHRHLLRWADHVVNLVTTDSHPFVESCAQLDSLDDIAQVTLKYRDRIGSVGLQLIEATGENLVHVIQKKENIFQYMTENGLLERFYDEGLGVTATNQWLAIMVKQISHRYPHMNILEVGKSAYTVY